MTGVTRKLGRIASVGAVALLLAGAAAAPAAAVSVVDKAEANKENIATANRCLAAGGDPTYVGFMGG